MDVTHVDQHGLFVVRPFPLLTLLRRGRNVRPNSKEDGASQSVKCVCVVTRISIRKGSS